MFITFYDSRSGRLGKAGVARNTAAAPGRPGTHLGVAGRRTGTADAATTRDVWLELTRWVLNTGYSVQVDTTYREAAALLAGGMVSNNTGTYRLGVRSGRLVLLYGHGLPV